MNIIEIKNLSHSYGKVQAVRDLSFSVREGELFALLGVNGAGKSTTINIICAALEKREGEVIIDGHNLDTEADAVRASIGVVFQGSVLDKSVSVYENLKSRAALYGIYGKDFEKRLAELCSMLKLDELLKRTLGKLSGGQRRRIDIARALIHKPKRLILDEPTTGLDPQTRTMLWEVISELRREERLTVLLTTHYMEEAADADYIVMIDAGKIAAEGTPLQLKNRYTCDYITIYGADEDTVRALALPYEKIRDAVRLSIPSTSAATELILAHPELFIDYEITKGKMDDVFLAVTGKALAPDDTKEVKK